MFALEFGAGLVAHSTALLAASVDMPGDALVYGFRRVCSDGTRPDLVATRKIPSAPLRRCVS